MPAMAAATPTPPARPPKKAATRPPRGTPKKATAKVCCSAFTKLSAEQRRQRVWMTAHQLHHNVKDRHRPPFTVDRLVELAECTPARARAVLAEAVGLGWFHEMRPAGGGGGLVALPNGGTYFGSPSKPK